MKRILFFIILMLVSVRIHAYLSPLYSVDPNAVITTPAAGTQDCFPKWQANGSYVLVTSAACLDSAGELTGLNAIRGLSTLEVGNFTIDANTIQNPNTINVDTNNDVNINSTGTGKVKITNTNGSIELGSTDPFASRQIWNYMTNASMRLGSLQQDGDPTDVNAEGIVVYGPNSQGTAINSGTGDFGYARVKADRFGLYTSIANTANYYFRVDPTSFYLRNDAFSKTFEVTRSSGQIDTALGAGVVHSDASGILSSSAVSLSADVSGLLPLANGGTNKNITAADGSIPYLDADSFELLAPTATAGLALISGANSAPSWYAPTAGSLLFAGTGGKLEQDNTKLFWDNTNDKLGIGTNTPSGTLDIFAEEGTTLVPHITLSGNVNEAGTISRNIAGNGGWLSLWGGSTASGGGAAYFNGNGVADGGSVQMTLGQNTANFDWFENTVTTLLMRMQNNGNLGIGTPYAGSVTHKLEVLGDIFSNNSLKLEDPGAGANYWTLQAPTLAANYVLTLPTDDGASGECLKTDGSGVTSWGSCAAASVQTIGVIDSQTKSANGLVISGTSLYAQTADATYPGMVSTAAQTIAGQKTLSSAPILSSLTASRPLKLDASNVITSSQIDLSSTNDITSTLGPTNGGTGQSTYATGDLLFASAANTLSKRAAGTNGYVLTMVGGVPDWSAPAATGITTLNTLTAATQTFATGTSGTDFNISSATSTHTFNIPDASGTNRGLVTTGAQSFGGAKTFASVIDSSLTAGRNTFAGTSGDLSDDADWLFNTTGNVVTLTNGQMNVDNLRLDLNTLSATDTNGSITVQSDGTGDTYYKKGSDTAKAIGSRNPELFNLLNYPSFEENVTEGTCTTATCSQESTVVINGTKSLKIAYSASTGNYLIDKSTSSQYSGTSYYLSCWIKADAAATGVQFIPRVDGADVTQYQESVIADGTWRQYETKVGSGTTSIGYKVNASSSITGNVYVDNCMIGLKGPAQAVVSDTQTFEGYWGNATSCDVDLGTTTDAGFVNLTTDSDCNTATEYLDELGCTMSTNGDFKITCDNLEPATYETCWEFNHNLDMAGTTGAIHFRTAYCNGSSLCATSGDNYSAVMQETYNQPVYREKMFCSNASVTKSGQLTINLQKQIVSTGGGISVNQLRNFNSGNRVRLLINKKKDISTVIANSQGPSQVKFTSITGCEPSTTSGTFADLVDVDCAYSSAQKVGTTSSPTTTGGIALKIPSVKSGRYRLSFSGTIYVTDAGRCSYRLYDGTNSIGPVSTDSYTGQTEFISAFDQIVEYTSDQTNLEIKLQGRRDSGSATCYALASADNFSNIISLTPISEMVAGVDGNLKSAAISSSHVVSRENGNLFNGDCSYSSPKETCTFTTPYSTTPICTTSNEDDSNVECHITNISTTQLSVKCTDFAGGTYTNLVSKVIMCQGQ